MTRPSYNEKFDYKAAHMSWVKARPNFESKQFLTIPQNPNFRVSYIDTLKEWYLTSSNYMAYINYYDDLKWVEDQQEIQKQLTTKPFETNVSFATIGFNHQEFTVAKAFEFIKAVLNLSVVLDGSFAVMENFRANGEHPHVHFKLYWSNSVCRSQVIQAIFRAKNAKKLVLAKNFIDLKEFIPDVHDNYLNGIKQDSKMKYVDMDSAWRTKNKIPDKVFKDTVM